MENSANALKMAFAVFAFVFALAVAFREVGIIKKNADEILYYTDETNYYEWQQDIQSSDGRVVGMDTVLSTIHNKLEGDRVIIYNKDGMEIYDSNINNSETFILDHLRNTKQFFEKTIEIKGDQVAVGEDNIKLSLTKGKTITYVIYKEVIL